jgi:hypothetical protein
VLFAAFTTRAAVPVRRTAALERPSAPGSWRVDAALAVRNARARAIPQAAAPVARPAFQARPLGADAGQPIPRPDPTVAAVPVVPDLPRPHGVSEMTSDARVRALAGMATDNADDAPVYSYGDTQVKPPRILHQQLPSQPSPNSQSGYFEFVVDTHGDVEALRLISPTQRYHDRMLVAAAKAWKFRPALLDGRPVKYKLRVAITLHAPGN